MTARDQAVPRQQRYCGDIWFDAALVVVVVPVLAAHGAQVYTVKFDGDLLYSALYATQARNRLLRLI